MGSWTSLIQARVDLERVLDHPESTPAARGVALKLLGEVRAKYDEETRKKQLKNPACAPRSRLLPLVVEKMTDQMLLDNDAYSMLRPSILDGMLETI
jgi:hypothetical protein